MANFGDELTDRERRVAGLLALGWTDLKISEHISTIDNHVAACTVAFDVTSAIKKLGLPGRVALALWAVDNALTKDERAQWVAVAEGYREALLKWLDHREIQLLQHLANPAMCDLSNFALGRLCVPLMGINTVGKVFRRCKRNIGRNPCKLKLAVVLHLAPLGELLGGEPDSGVEKSL
jgi:DNA-binding CsgD family transcriptional regulator